MKLVLILTISCLLPLTAEAGKWRGLISSVAAVEAAKVATPVLAPVADPEPEKVALKLEKIAPESEKTAVEFKQVCRNGKCSLVPVFKKETTTTHTSQQRRFFNRRGHFSRR